MAKDLLLELGTEELPARFAPPGVAQLAELVKSGLAASRVEFGEVKLYATPRRLAVLVADVAETQANLQLEKRGPSKQIAFDAAGNPTKAAIGFARGAGIDPANLVVRETEQGEYIYAVIDEPGKPTIAVLGDILKAAITGLNFPKSMRWASGDMRFARPLRWIVALYDDAVIDLTVGDVVSGRTTQGHRFLSQGDITVERASQYLDAMEVGSVVADYEARRELIRRGALDVAQAAGGSAVIDPELLDEVNFLVEYPTALTGSFNSAFLKLPEEALITPMQEHQRYFPVRDKDGKLLPLFIAVRNGGSESLGLVRKGNEKVLTARLSDAKFFYDEDLKTSLSSKLSKLEKIVFQEQLGTMHQKTERIRNIAESLADLLGHSEMAGEIDRAAELCKVDLVTHMVYEFPELQGIMGREYAKISGETEVVASAIYEHYLPRFAGDDVPQSIAGTIVGIADKIDTIVGSFGIGLIPTGSQDPYGLRRRTLGIIQVIVAQSLPINVDKLIDLAITAYGDIIVDPVETKRAVHEFIDQRLEGVLSERGYRYDLINAVLAVQRDDINDILSRLETLKTSVSAPHFEKLLSGFQRAANLVDKQDLADLRVDEALLVERAEKALFDAYTKREHEVEPLLAKDEYYSVMETLSGLSDPIDQFFTDVMVMVEDPRVRSNRLALLGRVVRLMTQVADLRKIVQQA